mgnify:FL=1
MSENNNFSGTDTNSYSQALYELSVESNCLDVIEEQVSAVLQLVSESKEFNLLIKDPTSKKEDQLEIINIICEKFNFNDLLKKFLNFLIIKRRIFYIKKILQDFLMLCSRKRGEVLAKLTSSKELNEVEIEKIKNDLSKNFGSTIKLSYKYDPNLIGGLIIQVGSVMIDTSIKNKLQQIKNKMVEA